MAISSQLSTTLVDIPKRNLKRTVMKSEISDKTFFGRCFIDASILCNGSNMLELHSIPHPNIRLTMRDKFDKLFYFQYPSIKRSTNG